LNVAGLIAGSIAARVDRRLHIKPFLKPFLIEFPRELDHLAHKGIECGDAPDQPRPPPNAGIQG
jgi:hypothetical protein